MRIVIWSSLARCLRVGDKVLFPVGAEGNNQIYVERTRSGAGEEILHTHVEYVSRPRRNRQGESAVTAEIPEPSLGIRNVHLPCNALRDYFFVSERGRAWQCQRSFYEVLQVDSRASPMELRVAFKLRNLELRCARTAPGPIRDLERVFNVLYQPESRACYDSLQLDTAYPAIFPGSGFGSLVVSGRLSRDRTTFYASRLLAFRPNQRAMQLSIPMRKIAFDPDLAVYRDSHHSLRVAFDRDSLPVPWDLTWNQWKHRRGTTGQVRAVFIETGEYRHHGDGWQLAKWEGALPSRLEVALPEDIDRECAEARKIHHWFGRFAEPLARIRSRLESEPIERRELQNICLQMGVTGDCDISAITWKPDYDPFFYGELNRRARRLYFFQSEYIFELEKSIAVETPQLGHATYLFSKTGGMDRFLSTYSRLSKQDVLRNRCNVAEQLGFVTRFIHGPSKENWLAGLKERLGECPKAASHETND